MQKERIFVGLSGGVDSSVAALRLKNAGHDVTGVFIKTWQPDFIPCTWEAERRDAMRVAAVLDIPFLTCDAEAAYRDDVAAYMIREYTNGRTPNPDVMCNKYVKFGAFLAFAQQHGAEKVATGHYARIREHSGVKTLVRGADRAKDQSYFLWTLTAAQRAAIYFPVGDTTKAAIRKEAAHASIPTAEKADSQGICFLGEIDMKEFLSQYIPREPGTVVDETGTPIGTHDGALFYTIGQRHGFTITHSPHTAIPQYVIHKDTVTNTLTVAPYPQTLSGTRIVLREVNWMSSPFSGVCTAQFRYRQQPFSVRVSGAEDTATLWVETPGVETPSLGQSCVFYDGDVCLGGGIIDGVE
jgi:tRNA-uridine 2-sulfurtransferase